MSPQREASGRDEPRYYVALSKVRNVYWYVYDRTQRSVHSVMPHCYVLGPYELKSAAVKVCDALNDLPPDVAIDESAGNDLSDYVPMPPLSPVPTGEGTGV